MRDGRCPLGARPHGVLEVVRGLWRHRPSASSALRRVRSPRTGVRTEGVSVMVPPGAVDGTRFGSRRRGTRAVGDGPAICMSSSMWRRTRCSGGKATTSTSRFPVAVHEAVLGARIEVPSPRRSLPADAAARDAGRAAVPGERPRGADAGRWPRRPDRARAAGAAAGGGRALSRELMREFGRRNNDNVRKI